VILFVHSRNLQPQSTLSTQTPLSTIMVARNLILAVGAAALVGSNAFVAPMARSVTVRSSTRTNMSVERQVDKAGDAIKDAGRDAKSAAKDVGNKAQNALDDLKGDGELCFSVSASLLSCSTPDSLQGAAVASTKTSVLLL
jgi:hypothetical protein